MTTRESHVLLGGLVVVWIAATGWASLEFTVLVCLMVWHGFRYDWSQWIK